MTKTELLKIANDVLKEERHHLIIPLEDRVQSGADLARAVLRFFNSEEANCPHNCQDCRETAKLTGNDLYDDDKHL